MTLSFSLNKVTSAWITFAGLAVYIWSLPVLAPATESYNREADICNATIPDDFCKGKETYFEKMDTHIGCGCGQGVFGQSVCPQGAGGYTISSYIGTPPATALMAILSVGPIRAMWDFGSGSPFSIRAIDPHDSLRRAITLSLVVFQISYCGFLFATSCVFATLHVVMVFSFTFSGIAHFLLVAAVAAIHTLKGDNNEIVSSLVIIVMSLIACLAFVGVLVFGYAVTLDDDPTTMTLYRVWVCECIGLTAVCGMAPTLMLVTTWKRASAASSIETRL